MSVDAAKQAAKEAKERARELRRAEEDAREKEEDAREAAEDARRAAERAQRRANRDAAKDAEEAAKDAERAARRRQRDADRQARDNERRARDAQREADKRARDAARDAERRARDIARDEQRRREERDPGAGAPVSSLPQRSTIAGPPTGGTGTPPPSSGSRRGGPGTKGWTLAPGSNTNSPGEGYDGLVLDIRCREADKTHLECPEYLAKFRGRNAAGFESFEGMAGRGTDTGPSTSTHVVGGGVVGGGTSQLGRIGDNSVNGGGPSTSVLDDPANNFDRTFQGKDFDYGQNDGRRVRDLLTEPDETYGDPEELPKAPDE